MEAIIIVAKKRSLCGYIINIHSQVFNLTSLPFKACEYRCSGGRSANSKHLIAPGVAEQGSKRNPSSEPEYHGEDLYSKNAELVCYGWKATWSQDQVDESHDRPDGAEEHVVGFSRGPRAIGPP